MSSSSDEGEIRDDGHGALKASHQTSQTGNGVDRQGRPRDPSPSHDYASRAGAAAHRPSRSPRGFKRSREDGDYYVGGHDRHDTRQPRSRRDDRQRNGYHGRDRDPRSYSHYDEAPRDEYRRSRVSYEDLDRPLAHGSSYVPNEGDHYRNRGRDRGRANDRGRHPYYDGDLERRSRSPDKPRRDSRTSGAAVRDGYGSRRSRHDENRGAGKGSCVVPKEPPRSEKKEDVSVKEPHKEPSPEVDYEEAPQVDEDAEIERRRKRREELLAKSSSATPLLVHAVSAAAEKARATSPRSIQPELAAASIEARTPKTSGSGWQSPRSPVSRDGASPNLLDDKLLMNTHGVTDTTEQDGPSAADYDPTIDMQEDERRDEMRHGQAVVHGEAQPAEGQVEEAQGSPGEACDEEDEFDMFAEDFDEDKYAAHQANAQAQGQGQGGILEGDDADGFYKIRVGELLNERYKVQSVLGQGMFARVSRAEDTRNKAIVAIKIIRNNAALRKAAQTEVAILKKLNDSDSSRKKHIVMFEHTFDHLGHYCMVFEGLEMNLREVLRKFGKNVGISLEATRRFARQIFVALDHMRKNSIIHADLKPDNILIHKSKQEVKICDLGTAIDRDDAATAHSQITPYLISRFYRAPEVILGMDYDYAIDVWSIGCTLFELFTGKILFPGENNNQMLRLMMELRGRMHAKYYKRGKLWPQHFDERDNFVSVTRDTITNKDVMKTMVIKPTRNLGLLLEKAAVNMTLEDKQEVDRLRDLLESCLVVHPERRITPAEALKHGFFHSSHKTSSQQPR
ncbi:hypothetical protein DCS_06421 [Drechmeria coniospora]|uniref:non-specific serine/threonine protein kinase n=1 Tax=Drechmeria coniospora TaxID=98403 RepID=A0A151GBN1_DRECN|nr:hypothetical protein DCS_06421 [Drechmeria coniospora]KYK54463.1 hypothetical protein DCS_06421 [Drechmeria coniospora]ODA77257.1 hypothetical protein RJ55_06884 [Drechmeria coniospora]